MTNRTIVQRLRRIDSRLATQVSRNRIGTLVGRVYWQVAGATTTEEVPIYKFVDQGTGTSGWGNQETLGHRYTVHVDGDFWDANRKNTGDYFVQPQPGDDLVPVEVESAQAEDGKTYTELVLRVKNEVDQGISLT